MPWFKVRTCKYQINLRKKLLILKIKTVKISRTISSKNLRKKYGNLSILQIIFSQEHK
jgi:hypothetical protein